MQSIRLPIMSPSMQQLARRFVVMVALVTVFEYPVWIGTIASSTLNSLAYVGDVIGVKREALAAHASDAAPGELR